MRTKKLPREEELCMVSDFGLRKRVIDGFDRKLFISTRRFVFYKEYIGIDSHKSFHDVIID